jgi:hypothetical protein
LRAMRTNVPGWARYRVWPPDSWLPLGLADTDILGAFRRNCSPDTCGQGKTAANFGQIMTSGSMPGKKMALQGIRMDTVGQSKRTKVLYL